MNHNRGSVTPNLPTIVSVGEINTCGSGARAVSRDTPRPGSRTGWGLVVDQGVEFGVWIGIAVLALIWANLQLWHTRRVLKRLRQDLGVPKGRLRPAAVAEMVSSVMAP